MSHSMVTAPAFRVAKMQLTFANTPSSRYEHLGNVRRPPIVAIGNPSSLDRGMIMSREAAISGFFPVSGMLANLDGMGGRASGSLLKVHALFTQSALGKGVQRSVKSRAARNDWDSEPLRREPEGEGPNRRFGEENRPWVADPGFGRGGAGWGEYGDEGRPSRWEAEGRQGPASHEKEKQEKRLGRKQRKQREKRPQLKLTRRVMELAQRRQLDKYESPSFLPGRHQATPPAPQQRVDYTHIQGLSTFPSERLSGRLVMVRCDWNVDISVNESGRKVFRDDACLRASLPTMRHLAEAGARVVVVSQFGTPGKGQRLQHSLDLLAEQLAVRLGQEVIKVDDCIGDGVERAMEALQPGQILVLENVQFYKEDTANDLAFAQQLASGVDIFVNDSLGPCSQASASVSGVPVFVGRRLAGLQLEKELHYLNSVTHSPARPLVAIVGGGKLSTRYALLKSLIARQKCDCILLGSMIAVPFLRALGWRTGGTPLERDAEKVATELLDLAKKEGVEIVLPTDMVCGDRVAQGARLKICSARHILQEWFAMDIGPQTIDHFSAVLRQAKTVLWVGGMGYSDWKHFANGTRSLAETLADLTRAEKCTTIAQGKDLERAIRIVGGEVSHVTLGGSAAVTLLTGGALPGLAALDEVPTGPPDWATVYEDPSAPLTVDIGCGDGGFLLELASRRAGNLLGLDLFGHLVDAANKQADIVGRRNLHYIQANATTSLGPLLSTYPGSLELVTIQYPTPQFEARGLGRLVLKQPLVEAIVENLVPGGRLFVQSDVEEVALSMMREIQKHGNGELLLDGSPNRPNDRSDPCWLQESPFGLRTQWEAHAVLKGRTMFRLMYRKQCL